jgi:hypothetical protein
MVCYTSSHCWSNSQCAVNVDEFVGGIVELHRNRMIFDLPREAVGEATLGKNDEAMNSSEKASAPRHLRLLFIEAESVFDPLRSEPRYAELERKIGLPQ